jgi:hypothetical protein
LLNNNYYIWVEITANKDRILNYDYFCKILDNCVTAGIGAVILGVKDITGFGIYQSSIVPHYSKYDRDFIAEDYLAKYIKPAHDRGLKIYAAVDVFAEGSVKSPNQLAPGYKNPQWQTEMYGIDSKGAPVIKPITDLAGIRTIGSIDDFGDVFVNPIREDVRDHELGIIRELANNYGIDGVVLDRVRFVGLASDFSDYTRTQFEAFNGQTVKNWPEDIYRLVDSAGKIEVEYGPLFGKWITFKAKIIKDFVIAAGKIVKNSERNVEFIDYTGSWYPLYYLLGANWASSQYVPEEYPWVGKEYAATGYAEYLDKLLSGFYYQDITIDEAVQHGKPAYWYSVEGSGDMLKKTVGEAVPFIGSLYAQQYEGNPEAFSRAIDMCFKKSQGCMLFDLSQIDNYHWWQACSRVF